MRLVIIESPYSGDVEKNIAYTRRAIRDSLMRGESPIASHLLYTQPGILRDDMPEEREQGINAGLAWLRAAEATVVYSDLGITVGMEQGIAAAEAAGVPVEFRSMGVRFQEDEDRYADPAKVYTPWSEKQALALKARQQDDSLHPYTCPSCHVPLVPRIDGWFCPEGQDIVQDWAYQADVDRYIEDIPSGAALQQALSALSSLVKFCDRLEGESLADNVERCKDNLPSRTVLLQVLSDLVVWCDSIERRVGVRMGDANTGALAAARDLLKARGCS